MPLVALYSEILPIVFYLLFFKRNKGTGLSVLFWYCIASILTEVFFITLQPTIDQFYIYSSFSIIEFSMFSWFFFTHFKSKWLKYLVIVGAVIFYTIAIMMVFSRKKDSFDSPSASFEAILMIIFIILFLYQQIRDPAIMFVYTTKTFWFVIALFLYFSSTLFLFLFAANLTQKERDNYWIINNVFEILKNLLFCVSLVMKKNNTKISPLESYYPDIEA